MPKLTWAYYKFMTVKSPTDEIALVVIMSVELTLKYCDTRNPFEVRNLISPTSAGEP